MNIFVTGLENNIIKKVFKNLSKNRKIKILGSLSSEKLLDLEISNQFIESDFYDNSFINNQVLNSLSYKIYFKYQFQFLDLIQRVNLRKMTEVEIKTFYIYRISFFLNFFNINNIKYAFFDSTPHFPIQFIIFQVLKYFKIKSIILHRTDISNLYILKSDISPKKNYELNISNNYNKNLIKNYFSNNKPSIWQKRSFELNERSKSLNKYKFFKSYFVFLELLMKVLYEEIFHKSNNTPSIFFLNQFSIANRIYLKQTFILKYQEISKFIRNNSIKPNLNLKFIYFGLHFQPERSTLPEGGIFVDQFKAIQILSKSIDKQTYIYVKEHPRQIDLYPDLRRLNSRNINFYQKILKLKNVKLIDTYFPSEQLLNKSFINSTITGSIGSDSIKIKKPVILFSESWYSESKFCRVVKNIDQCKAALKYFVNNLNYNDDFFFENLSKVSFKSNIHNFSNNKNQYKPFFDAMLKILI